MVHSFLTRVAACAALLLCALRLNADVVVTTNGARLVGRITSIKNETVTLSTDYAGEIKVKQTMVSSITTDEPVAVKFADESVVVGVISAPEANKQRITSPTKSVDFVLNTIRSSWAAGEEDPDVVARRRKWSYEASVDINGRSGTQNQLTTGYAYRAKLIGPDDTFQYYTSYLRQETEGQVSADQFKAGVDYADTISDGKTWYVRDEGGFDRVNDISLYDVAAAGVGYDFIKEKNQVFTGRVGLSYRYDEYSTNTTPSLSSAGADLELQYGLKFKTSDLSDKLTLVPAFQDLGNFVLTHEFSYNIPIDKSRWKLSTGVSNTYYSRPAGNTDKLDTLYFARLVLAWGALAP
jgi:putative salt-induced outer membrane protein YdiY